MGGIIMEENKMACVKLDGNHLTLTQVMQVVNQKAKCELTESALESVLTSRQRVEKQVDDGHVVYGVTTGFGKLSDVRIDREDVARLQLNLLRSHAIGVGSPFETRVVRAILLLRANALAKGYSGIKAETLQLLIDCLNHGIHPVIPSQGSLGASGDLAPLAHMALVLIGEGVAEYQGQTMSGGAALAKAGLSPVRLDAKEGLALINGTQAMTGVGAIAALEAKHLGMHADAAASLTIEALRGIIDAFDADLLLTRPYPEQEDVGRRILAWLDGSKRITHQGELRVQDAYSIRCIPQVHGASWQAVGYVQDKLAIEMNSATDNPVVLQDGRIVSGGQFHGQPIAISMDFMKIAMSEWANISERRIERLVNPQLSGLSAFLAVNPGLESGLMIAQYVAASLVSENKVLAHPASVDSIPSSANQEDHVSMGTTAARQARQIIQNAARVIAIELICASQAIYLERAENDISSHSKALLEWVRTIVPPLLRDMSISDRIEVLACALLSHDISEP
jgi:histidine ammonia-lyase